MPCSAASCSAPRVQPRARLRRLRGCLHAGDRGRQELVDKGQGGDRGEMGVRLRGGGGTWPRLGRGRRHHRPKRACDCIRGRPPQMQAHGRVAGRAQRDPAPLLPSSHRRRRGHVVRRRRAPLPRGTAPSTAAPLLFWGRRLLHGIHAFHLNGGLGDQNALVAFLFTAAAVPNGRRPHPQQQLLLRRPWELLLVLLVSGRGWKSFVGRSDGGWRLRTFIEQVTPPGRVPSPPGSKT